MLNWLFQIIKILLLLILPFIILIRGAVYFYLAHDLPTWMALIGGIGGTILILVLYFSFFYGRITGKIGNLGSFKRRSYLAAILVAGYCIHGLLFFSSSNAKSADVRAGFNKVHPILRLGASTLVHLDRDLLITDTDRVPEDYRKMGLPTKRHSLHYQQSNGFVHAIDIRTKGHSETRNFFLKTYFQMMGFNTLRHVGTDDHLHVSLKSKDLPGSI
ncbi:MAG: hypothetical protein KJP00_11880 [Bacteroidia bacterium]|nr:hypothetical protein [Bacteroidia bacterium]